MKTKYNKINTVRYTLNPQTIIGIFHPIDQVLLYFANTDS